MLSRFSIAIPRDARGCGSARPRGVTRSIAGAGSWRVIWSYTKNKELAGQCA